MSVSGSETRRAVAFHNVGSGGITPDEQQLQASEDRRLVGFNIVGSGGVGQVEISFSSEPILGDQSRDAARASTIGTGDLSGIVVENLDIDWSAGEEVHIHTRNLTTTSEEALTILYYVEK